jgi:hypothetical protein
MKNLTRNTAAVLVLTLFTGLAVFTAIHLGDRLFGTSEASAQTVTTQAGAGESGGDEQSADEDYYDDGASAYGDGYGQSSGTTDPYGYGQSSGSGSSGGGQTYTCPATGCTASSCHATQ